MIRPAEGYQYVVKDKKLSSPEGKLLLTWLEAKGFRQSERRSASLDPF